MNFSILYFHTGLPRGEGEGKGGSEPDRGPNFREILKLSTWGYLSCYVQLWYFRGLRFQNFSGFLLYIKIRTQSIINVILRF